MLGLTQAALAKGAGISTTGLNNIERGDADPKASTLEAIRKTLEIAGVEFIPENGGGPGVRLKKRTTDTGPKPVGPATDAVDAMDAAISRDRTRPEKARLASVKETGEEVSQEQWERFEGVGKKPGRKR